MAAVCTSSKCSFDLRLKALNPSHFMNSVCKTVPVSASMRISVVHIRKLCNYFFIFYPSKQKHQASKKLFFVLSHYCDKFQISKPFRNTFYWGQFSYWQQWGALKAIWFSFNAIISVNVARNIIKVPWPFFLSNSRHYCSETAFYNIFIWQKRFCKGYLRNYLDRTFDYVGLVWNNEIRMKVLQISSCDYGFSNSSKRYYITFIICHASSLVRELCMQYVQYTNVYGDDHILSS